MKIHIQKYFDHFGLVPGVDYAWDEYEWVVNNALVVATDIHHIKHGAHKFEDINNYIALTRNNHNRAHDEELKRDFLWDVHQKFMKENIYRKFQPPS